jgi:hypothetical protein
MSRYRRIALALAGGSRWAGCMRRSADQRVGPDQAPAAEPHGRPRGRRNGRPRRCYGRTLWFDILLLALGVVAALSGCGSAGGTPTDASSIASQPIPTPAIQNVLEVGELGGFAPLEPGIYSIDADLHSSTPLRVVFEIPADGWSQWIGAAKFSDVGHVGVSITTVTNLVRDGCHDHSRPDPPVGPTVDDLATGLADLAPFEVTAPPTDVTIYGYRGKHLELTVPDLPMQGSEDDRRFADCVGGQLKSWVDPGSEPYAEDAFYGYTDPGYTEEFWILDVEGTRLMIAAEQSPNSAAEDVSQMRAILDSIRIEP